MLRLRRIKKDYKVAGESVPALKGISINFRAREFVSILGPSGCGKTTLLNIIGGLDKYSDGDLFINGRSTRGYKDRDWDVYRNHRVGFVFQSYNLIPHQTVLGNVELALTIAGIGKAERRARAKAVLEKVGLGAHLNKRPNQLSGGQCQRVAIARALVNDPEILLADEPTGALDTKTSVQIMELIKEIAGERLVIMVTHNPELAKQYSTRIVRLLDGRVVHDSNPYSERDEISERHARVRNGNVVKRSAPKKIRKEKAKMGRKTAFALSARNLAAKKGRTIMVGIAGSIGIIGIAIVLAFSTGIQNYITSMETDMLSGYPVSVSETALDLTNLMSLTTDLVEQEKTEHPLGKVYVNQVVKTLTTLSGTLSTNTLTQDYIDFLDEMPREYYSVMQKSYGINIANNVYTHYDYETSEGKLDSEGNPIVSHDISITAIRSIFASVLSEIEEYKQYTSLISTVGTFTEIPDNPDYIKEQYDVISGEYPSQSDKGALILVLSSRSEINDILLAQYGYVSARELVNYAFSLVHTEEEPNVYYQPEIAKITDSMPYEYSKFCGTTSKKFTYFPNNAVFNKETDVSGERYTYNAYADDFDKNMQDKVDMQVKCILKPKGTVQYGSLSSGLYYTKALTDHIRAIETNESTQSDIVKSAIANAKVNDKGEDRAYDDDNATVNNITFGFEYYYDRIEENGEITRNIHAVKNNEKFGSNASSGSYGGLGISALSYMYTKEEFADKITEIINPMLANVGITPGSPMYYPAAYNALVELIKTMLYGSSDKVVYVSELGGSVIPSRIRFYTDDFNKKDLITKYLDKWNDFDEGYISDVKDQVKYTDTIGLIMTMVNTLITMITTALIIFTSISLVVSTVMIGIITYVSVVERVKEIGVIRAMGGRKRDVKNLFTSETVIIGFLAGLIGIVVTYVLSFIANMILGYFTGIYTLATLPILSAIALIALSVILTLISGLFPAAKAAKQDPVVALRAE